FFLVLVFLIISPLILGFIHINTLREDYLFLKENFSTLLKKIVLSISGCLLIITIPILIIINFSFERINLDNTLTYLYQVDYEKNKVPDINVNLLKKSLDNMIKQKSRNRFSTERTPFISQLYSYIVFDNLILSDEKISYIEKVFFSKRSIINNQNTQIKRDIKITELDYKTIYKKEDRLFHSYIDLKIKNFEKFDNVEYFTNIFLPKGSWVNNYYLYINDKKKYGLLAEKKSVLWIYNEIKNINRDPGILYYKDNENISLKVFPFFENEERKTGFEIIHIEPIELNIDENKIFLTDNSAKEAEELDNNYDFINYIDNNKINNLEKVTLKPYYHFIVDCSLGKKDTINVQLNKIKNILNKNLIKDYENSKITFLNHTYKTYNIKDKFENDIYKLKFEGGFFFDRIVKKNLFDTFKNEQLYPVIIVLNDEIDNIIWDKSILNFKWINPDLKFYHINNNNQIFEYNLFDFDISENKEITGFNNYNGYLLNINGTKRIVPIQNKPFYIYDFTKEIKNLQPVKLVDKALYLEYLSKYNLIYPNKEEDKFMEILKNSFSSNILTQLTSFVVLENEMQVKMLKKKQDEVINGKKYFDTTEETVQEMSEPGLIIMFIIFIIIIGIRFFIYKLWNKKNL
ncbi:MAG TPA: MSEP-CTERM sorting domain-containing protein, partial [Spirochaetota bacterium]|nr:MSEP-CTERM sorting domain-containing protein [Spirochaetota bacterium]